MEKYKNNSCNQVTYDLVNTSGNPDKCVHITVPLPHHWCSTTALLLGLSMSNHQGIVGSPLGF